MWGLDLSGSKQGVGGVGGLLAVTQYAPINQQQFVCYDGIGNVTALADTSSGAITGQYEYGPFGENIRLTGAAGVANPFQFSTKYIDSESKFPSYGFRTYNPSTGRWLSRDSIGERGGNNLYAFWENDQINNLDFLGFQGTVIGPGPSYPRPIGARPSPLGPMAPLNPGDSLSPFAPVLPHVPDPMPSPPRDPFAPPMPDPPLGPTSFVWQPPGCPGSQIIGFIQVGYGGLFAYNAPFVDVGGSGNSDSSVQPPLPASTVVGRQRRSGYALTTRLAKYQFLVNNTHS